jgi:hypothetical protein
MIDIQPLGSTREASKRRFRACGRGGLRLEGLRASRGLLARPVGGGLRQAFRLRLPRSFRRVAAFELEASLESRDTRLHVRRRNAGGGGRRFAASDSRLRRRRASRRGFSALRHVARARRGGHSGASIRPAEQGAGILLLQYSRVGRLLPCRPQKAFEGKFRAPAVQ